MLMALLKGKLSREQENMEDILTSNVFGLFQYLPPSEGLLPFLAQTEGEGMSRPLASLKDATDATAQYDFWPQWTDASGAACERLIRPAAPPLVADN